MCIIHFLFRISINYSSENYKNYYHNKDTAITKSKKYKNNSDTIMALINNNIYRYLIFEKQSDKLL